MNLQEIASKAFTPSSPIQDYKELYEETKKNVALFIAQVDNELSKILKKHEKEIGDLKCENESLKQQIKGESQLLFSSHNNSNLKSKTNVSTIKSFSQQKIKDFIDCGLSKISLAESKTVTDKKRNSIISYILQESDQNCLQNDKGKGSKRSQRNMYITDFDKQNLCTVGKSQLVELKQRMVGCKRAKRANICFLNDQESLKDVLKTLREKANTPVSFDEIMRKESEQRPKNILAPEMFTYRKK